jgi:hypothetical protein
MSLPLCIRLLYCRLAQHQLTATLAVSLHAPSQELRKQIVPSAAAYPIEVSHHTPHSTSMLLLLLFACAWLPAFFVAC